jgi:hypothetical protein
LIVKEPYAKERRLMVCQPSASKIMLTAESSQNPLMAPPPVRDPVTSSTVPRALSSCAIGSGQERSAAHTRALHQWLHTLAERARPRAHQNSFTIFAAPSRDDEMPTQSARAR